MQCLFPSVSHYLVAHHSEDVEVAKHRIGQEHEEVLMIEQTHAVAHPRAVVVHPAHALAAHATVMTPRRSETLALLAVTPNDQPALVGRKVLHYSVLQLSVLLGR